MEFYDFPYIGKNHPNWLLYFSEGYTTNQYIYGMSCDNRQNF
jgi:hypothetical protein